MVIFAVLYLQSQCHPYRVCINCAVFLHKLWVQLFYVSSQYRCIPKCMICWLIMHYSFWWFNFKGEGYGDGVLLPWCMYVCNNYARGVWLFCSLFHHTHTRNNAEHQQDAERCVTFKLTTATDSLANQANHIWECASCCKLMQH